MEKDVDISGLRQTDKNATRDNRLHYGFKLLNKDDPDLQELVDVRLYYKGGQTSRCCLWIHADGYYGRGVGKSSGCGYHRPSAAVADAFFDAGVKLNGHCCDGRGDGAIKNAMTEVAKAMGFFNTHIVECHP
jgi:hypothetical protein